MEVQNKDLQISQLNSLQPESIDLASFITLTNYINTDGGQTYDKAIFKAANDKLVAFSKSQQAWPICL